MSQLSTYNSVEEKEKVFKHSDFFIIDSAKDFDEWYKQVTKMQNDTSNSLRRNNGPENLVDTIYNHYPYIFRGVGDAKYKIFSSAQRDWNINDMAQWANKSYLEYVNDLVKKASGLPLLSKVFKYYKLHHTQTDFPTLSILQHYGAPMPLIDFTYNLDVALYFSTEFCNPSNCSNPLNHYF